MNEIVNKYLLEGDKFMPEVHLKQPGFKLLVVHLPKTKKELKSLCRLEIQTLVIKMNLTKHVFNTIWLMQIKKFSKKNSIRQSFER